jgi:hypothetical protein
MSLNTRIPCRSTNDHVNAGVWCAIRASSITGPITHDALREEQACSNNSRTQDDPDKNTRNAVSSAAAAQRRRLLHLTRVCRLEETISSTFFTYGEQQPNINSKTH